MNSNINKLVYIPMRADIIHPALINIINKGASFQSSYWITYR